MIEHIIRIASGAWPNLETPAEFEVAGDQLIITAGEWPDFDGAVINISPNLIALDPTDQFVFLGRNGSLYISPEFLSYGAEEPIADLLAWREDGEWHIKKLEVI